MAHRLGHITSLALASALVLTVVSVGGVSADDAIKRHWGAEKYAVRLMNCTRTGGWVKANGTCVDRGSGKHSAYRAPLRRHKKISKRVAFPWARNMVRYNVCGHDIAGQPGLSSRLRTAGYRYRHIGENVGCGWGRGSPKQVVLNTHRMFQAERSSRGGHWKNIKNKGYDSVGVGVAYRNGMVMVVYDFYGK